MKLAMIALALLFALTDFCFCADAPNLPGTYISKKDSKAYLILYPDGNFLLKQRKTPVELENPFIEFTGKYALSGEDITLSLTDGGEAKGKLKGNTFEDEQGEPWVKQGTEVKNVDRPKKPKNVFE